MKHFLVIISVLIGVHAYGARIGFDLSPRGTGQPMVIRVLDEASLTPVEGASVVASGEYLNQLGPVIQENFSGVTGERGTVSLETPFDIHSTLSVQMDGYLTTSVAGLLNQNLTVYLRKFRPGEANALVHGTLTDFPVRSGKSQIQAGIVAKSMSALDLVYFDHRNFLSPLKDQIPVSGTEVDIPSNLVLPKQSVNFGFFPVKLNKPRYRLPLFEGERVMLVGLQGEIPSQVILDQVISGKKFNLGILNHMKIKKFGYSGVFDVTDREFKQDIRGNVDLAGSVRVRPMKPSFESDVLIASYFDFNNDLSLMIPTDVKLYKGADVRVAVSGGAVLQDGVMAIALADKGLRLSGVLRQKVLMKKKVILSEFLTPVALGEWKRLPERLFLEPQGQQLGVAVINHANSTPAEVIYAVPASKGLLIDLTKREDRSEIEGISQMYMDLGNAINYQDFSGEAAIQSLERFARSTGRLNKE
ncbi:MAG: hypothetical protein CL678_18730 [Bdellovibrionaceae bacterium]|nr:hypothetical protein [Pseudobdellovibrionaceae bacterium]